MRYLITAGFGGAFAKLPPEHTIGPDDAGEPVLTWLAVGYHDIYE